MKATLAIQELAIAIAAPDFNPILLTPTFLKGSGIIPPEWELASSPRLTPQMAQVSFTNGINLIAQAGTMTFLQSIPPDGDLSNITIPQLATKYINVLPQLDYSAIAINPRSFLTFPDEPEEGARNYINHLFAPAPWLDAADEPMKASLNFTTTLDQHKFNLTINEVKLQRNEEAPQMAVLFSGNFPYPLEGDSSGEKHEKLHQCIGQWMPSLERYRQLVEQFTALGIGNGE
ncbi:MAG: hypothetical protein J7524_20320 [Roseofilum sp. Belize BBD 4]|uniref:hypothetical protein n=1 Tax=Roseofilum sp. Belize BBD 4 TaxID=2821500 RepID=UPI001B27B74F|nr:hypothetical protein [Roseofilum sp. Belize BBD 4]MBP0035483.1 hypothetical protein [Roseofilum sp. Belize BBD 4]